MHVPGSGSVKKISVLEVLKAHGVSVIPKGDSYILIKNDTIKVEKFSDLVHKRMLHALTRWFDISIHYFYHPDYLKK